MYRGSVEQSANGGMGSRVLAWIMHRGERIVEK